MGFFTTAPKAKGALPSVDLAHRLECRVCPLNKLTINKHPHMPPSGVDKPLVYILGEAPGAAEDKDGYQQFIGDSGQLLRARIPKKWLDQIRFNNVVRTRPPKNRTPDPLEIECCRPSVVRDIVASKPKAIFGFGAVPLEWATGLTSGIFDWRGRRLPVNIGGHECWYYPFVHPAAILRARKGWATQPKDIGSEDERAFVFDLKRAFAEVENLPEPAVHDESVAMYGVELIDGSKPDDLSRLEKFLHWAGEQEVVGVDYETHRLRPYQTDALVLTAAVGTDEDSFSFAIDHPQAKWKTSQKKRVRELWLEFLKSKVLKVVHNLAFEMEWTAVKYDRSLLRLGPWGDTMSQASILDPRTGRKRKGGPLSLEFLVRQYFGFNLKHLSDLDKERLIQEPLHHVLRYNAMDAKYHCLLYLAQEERLRQIGLLKQYEQALRRVPTCVLTQVKGVPVDQAETQRLDKKYTKAIKEAEKEIAADPHVMAFEEKFRSTFNPASNPHAVKLFRDMLKRKEGWIQDQKDKSKERYSVDEEILKKINLPLCHSILKFRKESKKHSTYLYKELIWPDGLLHPIFNTVWTETGRLSAEDPNLQNIPKRDEEAKEVRKQIKARILNGQRYIILAADYGQIEARCFAMASKDKTYVKALWDRFEIHGYWAERIARAYPSRIGGRQYFTDKIVMKKFRDVMKNNWTFPLFFGSQLSSVADNLEIPEHILQPEFREFKRMFPGIFQWQTQLQEFYEANGYVETLTGRRRWAPLSRNQVLNTPIQGTAADIVMDGMNRISEYAYEVDDFHFQPAINIHDDLDFFIPLDKLDYYAEPIFKQMVKPTFDFINVPLTVEASVGYDLMPYDEKKHPTGMHEIIVASSDGRWDFKDIKLPEMA